MARAKYEVCGGFPVEERDADGKWVRDVPPGDVVELDDTRTNITALLTQGVVKPVEVRKNADPKTDKGP